MVIKINVLFVRRSHSAVNPVSEKLMAIQVDLGCGITYPNCLVGPPPAPKVAVGVEIETDEGKRSVRIGCPEFCFLAHRALGWNFYRLHQLKNFSAWAGAFDQVFEPLFAGRPPQTIV